MKGIQKVWNGPCPVCNNTKHHRDDCYVERLLNHLQSSPVQDKPKLPEKVVPKICGACKKFPKCYRDGAVFYTESCARFISNFT
jgi:hypothetical protein